MLKRPSQSGKVLSAQWQGAILSKSNSEHFSSVPSIQLLVWFCIPGPQLGSLPVPMHLPTFCQVPIWAFGAALNIRLRN